MDSDGCMSVMSNSVKTKFAGLLRGLLRRLDDDEAEATAPNAAARSDQHGAVPGNQTSGRCACPSTTGGTAGIRPAGHSAGRRCAPTPAENPG